MVKISKASKMPGLSWSTEAKYTCPGAWKSKGVLVDACEGCYALGGNYRFPAVKALRQHNKEDWKRDEWVDDMVSVLTKDNREFRWFDSGDMYSQALAYKIYKVMVLTPQIQHWLPTRMHKFPKFNDILRKMQELPNVSVRLSSDSIEGEVLIGANSSTIIDQEEVYTLKKKLDKRGIHAVVCEAYTRGGKCVDCRDCWDKTVNVVIYPGHGKKMTTLIKAKEIS